MVLDGELTEIDYGKCGGGPQMGCLKEIEDLDPVATLESLLVKIFGKVNYDRCFFDLNADRSSNRL